MQTYEAFQSRYLAYCAMLGNTPEEQLEIDQRRYIGACMIGYIAWIKQKWKIWRFRHEISDDHALSPDDHRNFDSWLWDTRHEATVDTW